MQHLLTLNPEDASEDEIEIYSIRNAARAIVIDGKKQIALLHVSSKGYYKLPGGGLEDNESKLEALERECLEETGCQIKVVEEIGSIIEYRKIFSLKQTSYCYLVVVVGDKSSPSFTRDELSNNFELVWLSYDDALNALRNSKPLDKEGKGYIVPRDITFLEAGKELVKTI